MGDTEASRMGSVAGMYSMLRFVGMASGTALSGVILQHFLDQSLPILEAYQRTFLAFVVAGVVGVVLATTMREPEQTISKQSIE